ncbi:hypothetical protein N7493_009666 [Penicillium malachiteum]|uniref:Uncharacterized protein n=1 Tax=Penicillium malachiteum TaxID=1324776 RepID=A0AAD6HEI4_9EURO|nr:hypothetical protein N7493_009666 [Penicillium malachiteum]
MTTPTQSLLSNVAIRSALRHIKPGSHEGTVQDLWNIIVLDRFPSHEGYKYLWKGPNNSLHEPHIIIIQLYDRPPTSQNSSDFDDSDERQIFLMKCRSAPLDIPPNDTEEERIFDELLQALNDKGKIFGAVAIGKKVRFYRFEEADSENSISRLHDGTIDIDDPDGTVQVEEILGHIKANACQWTSS